MTANLLQLAYQKLSNFSRADNFWSLFETAFGTEYNREAAASLRSQWQVGDFSLVPDIEVISNSILGDAKGAYASSTNKIYLSDIFVGTATIQSLVSTLLEEYGHFVDAHINLVDSAGDEGAIFAALVDGQNLDAVTLQQLKAEDDHATILLNGAAIGVEQATVNPSADSRINALLGGYRWGTNTTATTITYSFYNGGAYYGPETGLGVVSNTIKSSVRYFLENTIKPLINVDFVEVADSPTSYGQIRYQLSSDPNYAYAYYPSAPTDANVGTIADQAGDVHLKTSYDNTFDTNGFQGSSGTHGYTTLIHETLHAIGLKHPGNYNGGGTGTGPFLPFAEDNLDNTVMSYNFAGAEPGTPMPYDLLALQYIYGARAFNTSNTTYAFSAIDLYSDGLRTVGSAVNDTKLTIWDTGGIDTLDFSGLVANSGGYHFDLNEGGWLTTQSGFNGSSYQAKGGDTSGASYSITTSGTRLAYGVAIEKAIGTNSNDIFYGNSLDNTFLGKLGNDIIYGANGNDLAIYTGTRAQYQISGTSTAGIFTISDSIVNRDGIDTLSFVESVQFSDQTISLNSIGSPTISIDDIAIAEGNSGITNAVFTVTLFGTATQPITVSYATANGTATAGSDYTSAAGSITFAVGENTKTISIPIIGDTTQEGNETFFVNLTTTASNVTIIDAQGKGTINNDDAISLVNDNFVNRSTLSGNTTSAIGTNIGATGEVGEPDHDLSSSPLNSVWWTWIAPVSGTATIDTIGSDFDTTLGIYTGNSVSSLTYVASSDDIVAGINRVSLVTFSAIAGTSYQIAVDGFSTYTGNINLGLNLIPIAANNNFANRSVLTGNSVTATATNIGATGEVGEPDHAGVSTTLNSVWWSWTATASGNVTISTAGSDFDTTLGVYTGSSVAALTTIASNDDVDLGVIRTSIVSFAAIAGTTYQIAVDGYSNDVGNISLSLNSSANFIKNDFGNDKRADILWRNIDGTVALWQMNGAAIAAASIVAPGLSNSWKVAGTGDFNADQKSDILWRNIDGTVALWQMNGAAIAAASIVATVDNSWQISATGDFNGDSKSDILWRNADGKVALWQMNGAAIAAASIVAAVDNTWKIAGSGDFNGDGKSDILWLNNSGQVATWLMNGATVIGSAVIASITADWKIKGIDDFDGDGKSDILWRNDGGQVAIWRSSGTGIAAAAIVGNVSTDWKIAGTGDFDGDRRGDILWRNDNGTDAIWFMNGFATSSASFIASADSSWKVAAPII
jgi:Calx-beta domain/FG-GAP-like repeat